ARRRGPNPVVARRPHRPRPGRGWRLLPDRAEAAAPQAVRGHRVEHVGSLCTDRRARPRAWARRGRARRLVRCRRDRLAAPAPRRARRRRRACSAHGGLSEGTVRRRPWAVTKGHAVVLAASAALLLAL